MRYGLQGGGWVIAALLLLSTSLIRAQTLIGDEYNAVGYAEEAHANRVARLAAKIAGGDVELPYKKPYGYFETFLKALEIEPDSQMLVYSPTSLQYKLINADAPRAVYFNDDTYIGWVKGSKIVEVATMDERLGTVFYIFHNEPDAWQPLERVTQRCLVCHDTYGMMGGGVPLLMVRSTIFSTRGHKLFDGLSEQLTTTDQTPIEDRWGGWYVTGQHGSQTHFGNVVLDGPSSSEQIKAARIGNLDTLQGVGFFDTDAYLRATSDIVALMVLEHQITIQNQITYVKFKAPVVLARLGEPEAIHAQTWSDLSPAAQRVMTRMLNEFVERLVLVDEAPIVEPISGNAKFAAWFAAQGPRDARGRSLRDLDLTTRLFRYPLSYQIYSRDFDTLPSFVKDYVYIQLAQILLGKKPNNSFAHLSKEKRSAILEILSSTKAEFLPYIAKQNSSRSH